MGLLKWTRTPYGNGQYWYRATGHWIWIINRTGGTWELHCNGRPFDNKPSLTKAKQEAERAELHRATLVEAGYSDDRDADDPGNQLAHILVAGNRLNIPMVGRLRACAADTTPNWAGAITVYPPEARCLVALIDAVTNTTPTRK